ncbi:MAG TPA: 16S rRNA (cytosine(1402)-N(4))-methyltransferase RsmH [Woeseiaceae bacterium]|nr:16S rRNA (cytosine(1402)-N(4))-methyltransferase RsmH [Woeseiaceae bacterium]
MSSNAHVPVLLGPVLEGLNIRASGCYVDATFGRGGHSSAILERLTANGRLIAIDRDPQAVESAPQALLEDPRFELIRGESAQLEKFIDARGLRGSVDGVLLDLGVSSPQLDEAGRGFSFLRDGPLDMRMDPDAGISAADWLAGVDEKELKRVLKTFGEEPHAARIARAIVAARETAAIETTVQLADIIAAAAPAHGQKRHPATKSFQAIRIFINGELDQLKSALEQSVNILRKPTALRSGGRLCVISFHSLEDRLVKRFMREASRESEQYRGMPSVPAEHRPKLKTIGRLTEATAGEIAVNRRARSARLRVAERL